MNPGIIEGTRKQGNSIKRNQYSSLKEIFDEITEEGYVPVVGNPLIDDENILYIDIGQLCCHGVPCGDSDCFVFDGDIWFSDSNGDGFGEGRCWFCDEERLGKVTHCHSCGKSFVGYDKENAKRFFISCLDPFNPFSHRCTRCGSYLLKREKEE